MDKIFYYMSNDIEKRISGGHLPEDSGKILDVFRKPAEDAGNKLGDIISKCIDKVVDTLLGTK